MVNPCHVPLGHCECGVSSVKPHGSDSSGNFVPLLTVEPQAAALAAPPLPQGKLDCAALSREVISKHCSLQAGGPAFPPFHNGLFSQPVLSFLLPRRIRAGTELTWDYNYEVGSVEGKQLLCCCGAVECRGRLL